MRQIVTPAAQLVLEVMMPARIYTSAEVAKLLGSRHATVGVLMARMVDRGYLDDHTVHRFRRLYSLPGTVRTAHIPPTLARVFYLPPSNLGQFIGRCTVERLA